ncbi:hypothetical protein T06_15721 [Trichinella sp. T6]|nr:hypothetical protein T06_15721 [Trichinella sp. T6]
MHQRAYYVRLAVCSLKIMFISHHLFHVTSRSLEQARSLPPPCYWRVRRYSATAIEQQAVSIFFIGNREQEPTTIRYRRLLRQHNNDSSYVRSYYPSLSGGIGRLSKPQVWSSSGLTSKSSRPVHTLVHGPSGLSKTSGAAALSQPSPYLLVEPLQVMPQPLRVLSYRLFWHVSREAVH